MVFSNYTYMKNKQIKEIENMIEESYKRWLFQWKLIQKIKFNTILDKYRNKYYSDNIEDPIAIVTDVLKMLSDEI